MPTKVKVLNSDSEQIVVEEEQPKILTSDYVCEVNDGISHRIRQSEFLHAKSIIGIDKSFFR